MKKATVARRWITQAAAAERLGCTERSVRNLIARGELPAYRIGSARSTRVDLADVDGLMRRIPATGGDAA